MKSATRILILTLSFLAFAPIRAEGEEASASACSIYFSPNGGATRAIVKLLDSAQRSIRLMGYTFSSRPIVQALERAHARGVDVALVLDAPKKSPRRMHCDLVARGVPIYYDSKHSIFHDKVIVVDDLWFETGSFNYTNSAERRNGENVLICKSRSIVDRYRKNWELHQSHSKPANCDR